MRSRSLLDPWKLDPDEAIRLQLKSHERLLLAWDGRPVSTVGGVEVVIFEHSGHDPFIEEQQFFK